MGKGSKGITASSTDRDANGLGSCEAHHVSISSQEDCGISTGKVGKDQAAKEGCIAQSQVKEHNRNQRVVPNVTTRLGHSRRSPRLVDCH
jgi:hypothetical protein